MVSSFFSSCGSRTSFGNRTVGFSMTDLGARQRGGLSLGLGPNWGRLARQSVAVACASVLVLQPVAALAADVTSYTYDEARSGASNVGRLTTLSNASATIERDYDGAGNVIRQSWTVGGTAYEHSFTYAPNGELLRRGFSDGDVIPSATGSYQYDAYGQLYAVDGLLTQVNRNANLDPLSLVKLETLLSRGILGKVAR
jgi:YD repeat-containing protein